MTRADPLLPGRYYATYAHEFGTAAAGALLRFDAPPGMNPENVEVVPLVHPDARNASDDAGDAPGSTGHYRNPLALSDGTLIASHTPDVVAVKEQTSGGVWKLTYAFRLRVLKPDGGGTYLKAADPLTAGLHADISWWNPDTLYSFSGDLWELDAVEVRPRARPTAATELMDAPEKAVFAETGVDAAALSAWLKERDLALIISRNVTTRDRADKQQPYNLRVPGGVSTAATLDHMYDVPFFQIFQGDALRGYGGVADPRAGRRLLARPMHGAGVSATAPLGPVGSVTVASDGSIAAFVPARRALTWQLTDATGKAVVRERNWVTFAAGEIRTCPACHGLNTQDQTGAPSPTTSPAALKSLLEEWKKTNKR